MDEIEEKTLDVSTQSCETHVFTTEYLKANVYTDVVKRLNEMIDNLLTKITPNLAESLMSTVNTLYCLGIITKNKADEYLKKLYMEEILTPCEHQYKTALDLFYEAIKLKDKERV